jgi:ATP-binding cassette, subfamily A (ABC1), member 3
LLYSNHSSAQIVVIGVVFFTGFVAVNAYFIMKSIEKTVHIADSLAPLFRMWPAYNLGTGLINMGTAFLEREVLGLDKQPFDWNVCGKSLVLLYSLSLPYLIALLFLEDGIPGGLIQRLRWYIGKQYESRLLRSHNIRFQEGKLIANDTHANTKFSMDMDVEKERSSVLENLDDIMLSSPVVFKNMWKIYFPPSSGLISRMCRQICKVITCSCCRVHSPPNDPASSNESSSNISFSRPKQAVRGLTVAIRKNETFVLLGE